MTCLLIEPFYKKGEKPPRGYLQWHWWARVQLKAGLRQRYCRGCGQWLFPQERCPHRKESA